MLQFIILAVVVSTATAAVRLDPKHFKSCDLSTGDYCYTVYSGIKPFSCSKFVWRASPRESEPWIQFDFDATYKVVGVIYEMTAYYGDYFKDVDVIFDNQVSRSIQLQARNGEQDFKIDPPVDSSSVKFHTKSAYSRRRNSVRRIYVKVDSEVPVGPAPTGTPAAKTTTAPAIDPNAYQLDPEKKNFISCSSSSAVNSARVCEYLYSPPGWIPWTMAADDRAPWVEIKFDGIYKVVGIRYKQKYWDSLFKDAEIVLDNQAPIKVVLFPDIHNNDFKIDPPASSDSVKIEFKSAYSWKYNGGESMSVYAKEALKLPPQIQLIPDKTISCSSSSHTNSSHSCEMVYPGATKGKFGWIVNPDDKEPWIEFKFDDTYTIRKVGWKPNGGYESSFEDVDVVCGGKTDQTITLKTIFEMGNYPIYPTCSASSIKFVAKSFYDGEEYRYQVGAIEIRIFGDA